MIRIAPRPDRAITRVYGRDPLKMIQGLATNDVANVADGVSVYTTFLTPKGKMIADARVWRSGQDVFIEADQAAAVNIREHLKKSVPPLFARFEPVEDLMVVSVFGGEGIPAEPVAVLKNAYREDVVDVVLKTDDADSLSSLVVVPPEELELQRIESGEPRWGAELTEDVIPLEAGLRHLAISETKGCYTGQEVIIRILHRGHVNRHLRAFTIRGTRVPETGTDVTQVDGKVVGKVTSASFSPTAGAVKGLAFVRREIEMPAMLLLGDEEGEFTEIEWSVKHGS